MSIKIHRCCTHPGPNPTFVNIAEVEIDSEETDAMVSTRITEMLSDEIPRVSVAYGYVPGSFQENFFNAKIETVKRNWTEKLPAFYSLISLRGAFLIQIINEEVILPEMTTKAAIQQVILKKITLVTTVLDNGLPQTIAQIIGSYFSFFLVEAANPGCCCLL